MNPSKHDQIWRDWMRVTGRARQPEHAPRRAAIGGRVPAGMAALASIAIVVIVLASRLMASPAGPGSSPSVGASGSPSVGASGSPSVTPSGSPSASPSGTAQPTDAAGAFRLTGSMTTARSSQTATRLADGRVLIVGGGLDVTDAMIQGAYASAEIYDPTSGTFKATGSMQTARGDHTATLLSDGRVLIAGGSGDSGQGNRAQAEIYDPSTGKFSVTGTMRTARSGAMAVLLHDGRVLIAGGFRGGTPPGPMASAELYNPATGKFSPTGSMSSARMYATATLLPDGRVLIAGGWDSSGSSIAAAELYDPATGIFSPTGSLARARYYHSATLLPDGQVLIAGGMSDTTGTLAFLTSAELYDPKTGTFAATGSMPIPCSGPVGTALSDGRVLIIGGYDGTSFLTSAELYDPKTGTFAETGSMSSVQRLATATLLSDGRVLIAGGFDPYQIALATAELFEP